jgi:periplasmic divalent cation tolerance protein
MGASIEVVLCTVPSSAVAEQIAHALLDERLVACVNVIPGVRSLYRWEGAIEEAQEQLLVMKTARDRYAALEARIRQLHPYEVCEVIALDVTSGSAPYLAWVTGETRP